MMACTCVCVSDQICFWRRTEINNKNLRRSCPFRDHVQEFIIPHTKWRYSKYTHAKRKNDLGMRSGSMCGRHPVISTPPIYYDFGGRLSACTQTYTHMHSFSVGTEGKHTQGSGDGSFVSDFTYNISFIYLVKYTQQWNVNTLAAH